MYFDTHTHLNHPDLYHQVDNLLINFQTSGGIGLIIPGTNDEWNQKAIDIASRSTDKLVIKAAIGYHPSEILSINRSDISLNEKINKLKENVLTYPRLIMGIGEAGIDLYYPNLIDIKSEQKKILGLQADLAQELNLPLIIHSRNAFNDTMDVLINYSHLTIYFHCWSYGIEELQYIQNKFTNYFIGFTGNITYKNNINIFELLKPKIELSRILLETDSPYLPFTTGRKYPNKPENIRFLYQFVADKFQIPVEHLQSIIRSNVNNLLFLKKYI